MEWKFWRSQTLVILRNCSTTTADSNTLKRKTLRLTSNRTGDADFKTTYLFVDDRFNFTLGRVNGLGVAKNRQSRPNLPKFELLIANMQI